MWEYFPSILKKILKIKMKGKGKENELTYLLFTLYLIQTSGGL